MEIHVGRRPAVERVRAGMAHVCQCDTRRSDGPASHAVATVVAKSKSDENIIVQEERYKHVAETGDKIVKVRREFDEAAGEGAGDSDTVVQKALVHRWLRRQYEP